MRTPRDVRGLFSPESRKPTGAQVAMADSPELNQDIFEQRLAEAIDVGELLSAGASVLVGVSGGTDSIALLHGLKRLAGQPARAYRLVVGHLDHTLRADSAGDADFVAAQADALGLECIRRQCDVTALAQQQGQGVEQAARMARYRFFREAALACRAQVVAVAHQADDNVETILFRLFRGTALRGLAGMADKRPLPESGIMLVRPMLGGPHQRRDGLSKELYPPRIAAAGATGFE
jgi:tRNA(Ile)-lysidine synthase